MTIIKGKASTRRVQIGDHDLIPTRSQRIVNHSPDGFNWGYGGSGPAQLALAILLEFVPADVARRSYQDFKREVIAALNAGRGLPDGVGRGGGVDR